MIGARHVRLASALLVAVAVASATAAGPRPRVYRIVVDGPINPAVAGFVEETVSAAGKEAVDGVLIQLDTPGGLLPSTRVIVKQILDAPVPVIVYVGPSGAGAGSAGVFITMAAHVAAMAPGTNIGAAHPVGGQGQDIGGVMGEKIESFTASFAEAIAERRGRNVEWAIKAVRESASVAAEEAAEIGVVDFVAADLEDVFRQATGREIDVRGETVTLALENAIVETVEMRFAQRLLDLVADPNIAYLLMMAGMLGLYIELTSPGFGFPGIAGAICLILALTALHVLAVNYGALALIVVGVALLIAEVLSPSFGVLGAGGIVAFLLGSLFLFDVSDTGYQVARRLIFQVGLVFVLALLLVSTLVVRVHRRPARLGREGLIGERGVALERLGPDGRVRVHGEIWTARASGDPVDAGEPIEIEDVDGLVVVVRRCGGDTERS